MTKSMSKFLLPNNQYFRNLTSYPNGHLARKATISILRQNPKLLIPPARTAVGLVSVCTIFRHTLKTKWLMTSLMLKCYYEE